MRVVASNAIRIGGAADEFGLERDRLRYAANFEIADDVEAISAGRRDACADETDVRMRVGVQEVFGSEARVALRLMGVMDVTSISAETAEGCVDAGSSVMEPEIERNAPRTLARPAGKQNREKSSESAYAPSDCSRSRSRWRNAATLSRLPQAAMLHQRRDRFLLAS